MARGPAVAMLLAGCGRLAFDPTSGCPDPQTSQAVTTPAKYVSPTGSNTNAGTAESPWGTVAYALTNAAAEEHIVLLDGEYTEALRVTVDGRTVRAQNDGRAIFDGGAATVPCRVNANDVTVEGIHCRNGSTAAFDVLMSSNVIVRRVTAHTSQSARIFHIGNSSDVLLEDAGSWGSASQNYLVNTSARVTVRRCWARWDASTDMDNAGLVLADDVFDARVENCVLTSTQPFTAGVQTVGISLYSSNQRVDRSQFVGNVVRGFPNWAAVVSTEVSRIEGTRFVDTVLMRSAGGLYQRSDANFGVERLTAVEIASAGGFVIDAHSTEPKNGDFEIAGYVRDSVLARSSQGFDVFPEYLTSFTHTNNTLFDVGAPYTGVSADPSETIVDPGFDRDRYGDGAYLIRGPQGTGANVLYQVENGVVTDTPLWPWPLEDRILAESGTSVTWESGGGLWRALPDELVPADECP